MKIDDCCKHQISALMFEILSEIEGFKYEGYAYVIDEEDDENIQKAKEIENVVNSIYGRIKDIAKRLEIKPVPFPENLPDEIPF